MSDRTWLQQLGEEHCNLVKSLSQISDRRDNLEVRLNITQQQSQVVFRGESETLAEDQSGVESSLIFELREIHGSGVQYLYYGGVQDW